MKNNLDLWTVLVGVLASLLKALKNKLTSRETIIAAIVGGLLAFGTLGLMDIFFSDLEPRVIMLVAFTVGWVANELTDVLDSAVKDSYDLFKEYARSWAEKKKK